MDPGGYLSCPMLLMPPYSKYTGEMKIVHGEYYAVSFSYNEFAAQSRMITDMDQLKEPAFFCISNALMQYMLTAFDWLLESDQSELILVQHMLTLVIPLLVHYLQPDHRHYPTTNETDPYPKKIVRKTQDLIHENYTTLTLNEAASLLFVNASYLSRIFRQYTGSTFSSYLTMVRLGHAQEYLVETNLLITDIANRTGFSSSSHLASAFKKAYNISPKDYRNNNRKSSLPFH